ncbi:MAG: SoxR reducing system RseC family protein [Mariprofundales bacterium]|nr:SoxR reducing system RseC family protein [Mariprofundales bacterium]
MRSQLEVIAVDGEIALLQGVKKSACGSCAGRASCSTMGSWVTRALQISTDNTLHAKEGDLVEVEVADHQLMVASLLLYGLPLLALFIGGIAMRWLFTAAEASADIGFLLGGAVGMTLTWWLLRQLQPAPMVRMIRICSPHALTITAKSVHHQR